MTLYNLSIRRDKMINLMYKIKYDKLKKDFDNKVNKRANEIYRERQTKWIIKEAEYKQELRFKTLEIRQLKLKVKELNDEINRK